MDKFYITTPIYYANSRPHVGSAYTTIVCDVIARYKRMCGQDVAYLTGTDEHGVNIERAAEKLGISPGDLVDRNQKIFLELWKLLGIQYTNFIRTTSTEHARAVQGLVRRTMERSPNAIYKAKYEGRYCIYDNLYVSDTPEPADCQICGRPAELISEENYFFRLSAYQQRLLSLYEENPQFILTGDQNSELRRYCSHCQIYLSSTPEPMNCPTCKHPTELQQLSVEPDFRRNEVISFVRGGLKDISISRKSIKWGIPWPDDPQHVFYVWYDALTSYLSGIGFVDGKHDAKAFKEFWPADLHMIGKEIIRFHAVYWPAFLMAAELPLPKKIFAHGWLLFEQEKMSKSKGNVAYPEPIVKGLNELTGANVGNDALRYYLLRETVFGHDGNFSRDALITRYNADLANGLGNLASRTLKMIEQYCEGRIPASGNRQMPKNRGDAPAEQVMGLALEELSEKIIQDVKESFEGFNFSSVVGKVWVLIAETDHYLSVCKPWAIAEDGAQRPQLEDNLYRAAQVLGVALVLAHPVIPDGTEKIWKQFGQTGKLADVRIDQLQWGGLKPGTKIGKPEAVFPRVDKKEASERIEAMENEIRNPASAPSAAKPPTAEGTPATSVTAAPPPITIDDFAKINFRVGVVKSAEKVAGADKLLKVMVDLGDEVRQIVAGIATAYTPEELPGRKVVVVTNLAPRKLRGVESNGMILAASAGPDGKPVLCTFTEEIPPGAKVK
jgi:methionyl-tRNA synthetase